MGIEQVDIIVDARESRSSLPDVFEAHDQVNSVRTELLSVGDIIVNEEVVFERKTINDFVSSIQDRRLETQIEQMYQMFGPEKSYVVIEGALSDFEKLQYSKFSPEAAWGYSASITARWQCTPLYVNSKRMLVDQVVRIGRKHFEKTTRVVRKPEASPSVADDDYFSRAVLQLSGIGRSKISPLRRKYSSIENLSKADVESLQEIDGIGSKTATKIVEEFRGER
jgi:ERCC4-type nuclease